MFSADLSWTDDRSQMVGERRNQQKIKKIAATSQPSRPQSSLQRSGTRASTSSSETARSAFRLLEHPLRRFRASGLSRKSSSEKDVHDSNTGVSYVNSHRAPSRNGLPSPGLSQHPEMHFEEYDISQDHTERSLIDSMFSRETYSSSSPKRSSGSAPIVIKTVSISVESNAKSNTAVNEPKQSFWSAPTAWTTEADHFSNQDVLSHTKTSSLNLEELSIRSSSTSPEPCTNDRAADANLAATLHFKRLIKRMESASPQLMLDRLEEDWGSCDDPVLMEELRVEKLLWALTALDSKVLTNEAGSEMRTNSKSSGKIVHFEGSMADVYRTINRRADSKVIFVSTKAEHTLLNALNSAILHKQINFASSPEASMTFPLPLRDESISDIYVSNLPTLLTGSRIPAFLAESFRLLEPKGTFEARLINAMPERSTLGPLLRTWLEDNLMIQLEAEFRCSRPCDLMPAWSKTTGFGPTLRREQKLQAAVESTEDKASRIGTAVLREVWKDTYSPCLIRNDCGYWWDDQDIIQECLEKQTTWSVVNFVVIKPSET